MRRLGPGQDDGIKFPSQGADPLHLKLRRWERFPNHIRLIHIGRTSDHLLLLRRYRSGRLGIILYAADHEQPPRLGMLRSLALQAL